MGLEHFDLWWQGYSGMGIQEVRQKIRTLLLVRNCPNYLVLHCGGNDIGKIKSRQICNFIKAVVSFIQSAMPGTKLVWSQLLPRLSWRYSKNIKAMDKARKRINSFAASLILKWTCN